MGIGGNSLAVQWLGLGAFTAEGAGSIPGRGTKIPPAVWCGQKNRNWGLMGLDGVENYCWSPTPSFHGETEVQGGKRLAFVHMASGRQNLKLMF